MHSRQARRKRALRFSHPLVWLKNISLRARPACNWQFVCKLRHSYCPELKLEIQYSATWVTTAQARMPEQQRNELEELKRLRLQVRKQPAENRALFIRIVIDGIKD